MASTGIGDDSVRRNGLAAALDTAGWGLFFIWVGIAFWADVGWGAGLFAVGVIGLAMQTLRFFLDIPLDRFGLAVAVVFTLAGAWKLLDIQLPPDGLHAIWPAISLGVGVLLVVAAFRKGH